MIEDGDKKWLAKSEKDVTDFDTKLESRVVLQDKYLVSTEKSIFTVQNEESRRQFSRGNIDYHCY